VGRLAHALPPQRAAQLGKADCHVTSIGGPAADVPPSAATGASVEPVRANRDFSGRASGVAGDQDNDLAGVQRTGAQRCERNGGQFVKQASFTHSVKEKTPAIPVHGNGPRSSSSPAQPA
jgi:hypothetical protein